MKFALIAIIASVSAIRFVDNSAEVMDQAGENGVYAVP